MKSINKKTYCSLLFLTAAALAGCDSDSNSTSSEVALLWSPCEKNSQLECAELEVPMTHTNPGGEKIKLALNRMATTSASKQGSLLFNPGGPGSSGTDMLYKFAEDGMVPDAVQGAYDLIGFDPRGIKGSTPVDCSEFINEDTDDYPRDLEDLQAIESDYASFVESCVEKYGNYLQHLGSAEVVDDMESIRKALGESKLDFIGYSYGTRLAGLYAQTYPTTTGRVVLDASVSPTHSVTELFEGQLEPHENNLRLFAELCSSHSDCDPVAYKQQIIDHVNELVESENDDAIDIVALVLLGVIQNPELGAEITEPFYEYMQTSDISGLVGIAAFLLEESEESENADETVFDETAAQRAVICADDAVRPTAEDIEALRGRFNEKSDLIAELQLVGAASCMGWPEALRPLAPIATDTAPELLVIAGPMDTLTPTVWSERMAQAIGARYLLSEHPGHTVVFSRENSCTDQVVVDYLVDGVLPDIGICAAP